MVRCANRCSLLLDRHASAPRPAHAGTWYGAPLERCDCGVEHRERNPAARLVWSPFPTSRGPLQAGWRSPARPPAGGGNGAGSSSDPPRAPLASPRQGSRIVDRPFGVPPSGEPPAPLGLPVGPASPHTRPWAWGGAADGTPSPGEPADPVGGPAAVEWPSPWSHPAYARLGDGWEWRQGEGAWGERVPGWWSMDLARQLIAPPTAAERERVLARRTAQRMLAMVFRKCFAREDGPVAWREGYFPWERTLAGSGPFRNLGRPWRTAASTPQSLSAFRLARLPTATRWRDRPWWERVPPFSPPLSPRPREGSSSLRRP